LGSEKIAFKTIGFDLFTADWATLVLVGPFGDAWFAESMATSSSRRFVEYVEADGAIQMFAYIVF